MNRENLKGVRRTLTRLMSLGLLVGAASCDTDVVNPGPIESDFLDQVASQYAITNGAGRALGDALNWIAYTSSAVAREVHPSGSTGSFGITPEQQRGELSDDEVGTQWENAHRARFLVSDGIRRLQGVTGEDDFDQENLDQLFLYGGYTSRLLGESMCNSVFDGGPPGSSDLHLDSAIAYFTTAMNSANADIALAAQAGRASAYQQKGEWANAVSDAQAVLTADPDFSYALPYFDIGDDNQGNRIYIAGDANPYKAHSQIFTWIAEYNPQDTTVVGGIADADPRVAWQVSGENGDAASSCCGLIQWFPQQKYTNDDAPIELSSAEEMQLILAEDALRNGGDIATAMGIVNELRTAAGLTDLVPETGITIEEALTFYKREHAIEMWLEGRRLPAMRRWNAAGDTEATLQPLEQVGDGDQSTGSHLETREFCFPISRAERQTNENVPIDFEPR
jgi:hypothetical protein